MTSTVGREPSGLAVDDLSCVLGDVRRSTIDFDAGGIGQPRRTRRARRARRARRIEFDDLSHRVIGCAIEVHRALGPGLLESAYEQCLAHELARNRIPLKLQHPQPGEYKGIQLDCGYRIDLLVDDELILELKSVDKLTGIHEAQLLTYMKLADVKTGQLINFNVTQLKEGIKRFVI